MEVLENAHHLQSKLKQYLMQDCNRNHHSVNNIWLVWFCLLQDSTHTHTTRARTPIEFPMRSSRLPTRMASGPSRTTIAEVVTFGCWRTRYRSLATRIVPTISSELICMFYIYQTPFHYWVIAKLWIFHLSKCFREMRTSPHTLTWFQCYCFGIYLADL